MGNTGEREHWERVTDMDKVTFQEVKRVSIEVGCEEEAGGATPERGSRGLWDPARCVIG